jgi:hypothetical protein
MVMQAAIWVAIDKAVNIDTTTTRKTKQVITFQIGFSLIAINDSAPEIAGKVVERPGKQGRFLHLVFLVITTRVS